VTPAEADVGVMPFGLGKLTDLLHERECFPEIAESKRALDAVCVIAQFPIRRLCLEAQGFIPRKWWNAPTIRRARLLGESFGHVACLQTDYWGNRGSRRIRCRASR
jgi:hypothetical protein